MPKCLKCGNDFEGSFCSECGFEHQLKVCTKCGTKVSGKYCSVCGTKAQTDDIQASKLSSTNRDWLIGTDKSIRIFNDNFEMRDLRPANSISNKISIDEVGKIYYEPSTDIYHVGFLKLVLDKDSSQCNYDASFLSNDIFSIKFDYSKNAIFSDFALEISEELNIGLISDPYKINDRKVTTVEKPYSLLTSFGNALKDAISYQVSKDISTANRAHELESQGIAYCPKCLSTSLSGHKKGFGIGKAVVGAAMTGGIGLIAGNIGAKKVRITCLNCGHQFWAGKR